MGWLVFSYSLPAKASSSPRVALWRRLQRLGAITPKAGVYVLPERDECVEAFQWLAQEVQHAKGEAVVMRVERFEGLSDQQLVDLFHDACREKYLGLESEAAEVEKALSVVKNAKSNAGILDNLERLQKRYTDTARVDFFESPEGRRVAAKLRVIEQSLRTRISGVPRVAAVEIAEYKNRRWVTRPRPHVDRLACVWLIRRFIDPSATIRYSLEPDAKEVSFDMRDAVFGHTGNLCTFETMLTAFELKETAFQTIAEIVHEIDIRDGRYTRPETGGIEVILKGWLLEGLPDSVLESQGMGLFEALYTAFSRRPGRGKKR
jgi:hypothetical protein